MFMLPELKPEEILIYLRKSRTDDPALSVQETVAKHEQMLDDYSLRIWGELIPERNRFREVVSGETIAARPEIQKVLRLVEQPCFRAILIVEPQRLSRGDLEDIGRLSKLLRYTGTIIITLQYSYDLTDERDRDYFERELKRGNEYLEYSKRIMMNGRGLSAERGNYTGSRKPYGYKRVFKKEGNRKYPTLEIIPEEAEIVRIIFRMYAEGNGATRIASHLNSIGSKPQLGGIWSPASIYSILDNVLYNGKIKYGFRKIVRIVEDGEIHTRLPRNHECPVYEGRHEAIIDDALWSAVRARREAGNMPKVKVSKQLQNPLSGLVYCECGRMMIRRPFNGRASDRYQCPNQTYCGNASCIMDDMHAAVTKALRSAVADFQVMIVSDVDAPKQRRSDTLKLLQAKLAEAEHKESALWEKFAEDGMPRRVLDELLAKVEKQKADISDLIRKEQEQPEQPDINGQIITFSSAIAALNNPEIPAEETNKLMKACIRRITYSRRRGKRVAGGKGNNHGGWSEEPIQLEIELNF